MLQHNHPRCPDCDGFGKVVAVKTQGSSSVVDLSPDDDDDDEGFVDDSPDWDRVKRRTLECRDCGRTWQSRR